MKSFFQAGALCLFAAFAASAQPVVNAVLNNASYALPPLTNSAIARGSLFAVFGSNLATGNLTATSFPIQTSMGGTSVRVTVGATTVDCLMIYTTQNQIGAVLPSNTPTGNGQLVVTLNGQSSAARAITVVNSAFGIFTANQAGSGPGAIQIARSEANRPVVTATNPARPGEAMIIWGTGLGPISGNDAAAPAPADLPVSVEVFVGGQPAAVSYKGRSGCCTGIDQIVFTVPNNVEGCYVPVVVKIGDVVSNFATIAVARQGQNVCSDTVGLPAEQISAAQSANGLRVGTVVLSRSNVKANVSGFTAEVKSDSGSAGFVQYNLQQLLASQTFAGAQAVSMGSCTVATFQGTGGNFVDPVQPTYLDAGPQISVARSGQTRNLTRQSTGTYSADFGTSTTVTGSPIPIPSTGSAYLDPGSYTISGPGGSQVGAFNVTFNMPALLNWTNQDAITTVTRSAGQRVTWTGGDPNGQVFIGGSSMAGNVVASFTCLAPASAGSFDIPSYVLLLLPPTQGQAASALIVGGISAQQRFNASGLDYGVVTAIGTNVKTVTFR